MSTKIPTLFYTTFVVALLVLFTVTNSTLSDPINVDNADNADYQKYPPQWSHSNENFWNTLKERVFILRPYISRQNPFNRKRSCFINAGMTNNCDFKDLISAASARRIWQSPNLSPGKRSGNSISSFSVKSIGENFIDPQGKTQDYDLPSEHIQAKRMQCISGLPGGDCENSFLGAESMGQDFLKPGGRNPGRR